MLNSTARQSDCFDSEPGAPDLDEAERFLSLLDPNATSFTFQTFKEKGSCADVIPQVIAGAVTLPSLQREHERGAGIYVTVNETDGQGRKTENIKRIRAVFQEDDDGYQGDFPLVPSMVIETSPGHFHRYWLIKDAWPADEQGRADFTAVMGRMVASYGSDPGAKDISRVMRLPGFLHRKAYKGPVTPRTVRIIETDEQGYTRAEIMAAFPPVPRAAPPARVCRQRTRRHGRCSRRPALCRS